MSREFDMSGYKTVPERIEDFRSRYPNGSLQPLDPARPYWIETIGEATFIVYAAAAYRTAGDAQPGIGLAWEPFPGKTPYTKDSELQNAETSAWGRAIVAVLASDTRKGIASAEDVRARPDQREETLPAGWERLSAMEEEHARVSVRVRSLPEEVEREPFRLFTEEHGWPMAHHLLDQLDAMAETAERDHAERDPGRPFDEPERQEPVSPEDPPKVPADPPPDVDPETGEVGRPRAKTP